MDSSDSSDDNGDTNNLKHIITAYLCSLRGRGMPFCV